MPVILKTYLLIFLGYMALEVLVPTTYAGGDYSESLSLMTLFFILSFSVAIVVVGGLERLGPPSKKRFKVLRTSSITLLLLPLLVSCLAMAALFYDRIFIQGIDYSKGVAYAREAWRAAGEHRTGVSSVFSVLGNLFSSFYFVSVTLIFLEWERHERLIRWVTVILALSLLVGNSFLLGGRSLLMMAMVTIITLALIRKSRGQPYMPFKMTFPTVVLSLVLTLSVVGYGVYVFHLRAQQNDITSSQYLDSMSAHLGGVVEQDYECFETDGLVCDVLNYSSLAGSYLTHSAWTFQASLDLGLPQGNVLFNFYRVNFSRVLGISHEQSEWAFVGLFISLPGALFYDFGLFGLIAGAVLLGGGLGGAQFAARRDTGLVGLSFILGILYIAFLFPLVPAMDIMSFPFIMFGFGAMWTLSVLGSFISGVVRTETSRHCAS